MLIAVFIANGNRPVDSQEGSTTPLANAESSSTKSAMAASSSGAVDPVVATSIASSMADMASMPVSANVATLSQTLSIEDTMVQSSSDAAINKPQVVQPSASSRAASTYVTKAGDTVESVAGQYGLKKETIAWANNLSSDALEPNTTLLILPTDGVQHTVKSGDTADSIASKYGVAKEDVVSYNDLELASGLSEGSNIIIPGGVLPEDERPGYTASSGNSSAGRSTGSAGSVSYGGSRYNGVVSAGNKYAWGNCTWYAYERRMQLGLPIGSYWGNASTWAYAASSAGLLVDGNPTAGSIMQNSGGYGGYGHVAIVESVNPGNSIIISEMNGYRFGGGYARVGRGTIPWSEAVSGYYKYIH